MGRCPRPIVAAAVDAVAASPAVLRDLAAALAADPDALAARCAAGRRAAGRRADRPRLDRRSPRPPARAAAGPGSALPHPRRRRVQAVPARQLAVACARCGEVKPRRQPRRRRSAGLRRCRRSDRAPPPCGICGKTASVAVRGPDGPGHLRQLLPDAQRVCIVCGKYRDATSPAPATRSARRARRGPPPAAPAAARTARRTPAGPKARSATPATPPRCAAGGRCAQCGQQRRLVAPPGPAATPAPAAPGCPPRCACTDCGLEDKLYETRPVPAVQPAPAGRGAAGRARRQSRRAAAVLEAICAARTPKSALNWLRRSGGAAMLADLAAGG